MADEKLDGERIICHKRGDEVVFVTRNHSDYSEAYSVLTAAVRRRLARVRDCIVDGEVQAVNRATGAPVSFGSNQTFAKLEKRVEEVRAREGRLAAAHLDEVFEGLDAVEKMDRAAMLNVHLEFFAFDVLYVDDEDGDLLRRVLPEGLDPTSGPALFKRPLRERRAVL